MHIRFSGREENNQTHHRKDRTAWTERILLFLYLAGFLVMALTMALNQPMANLPPGFVNPPDEHARFLIPKYICENGSIPTGLEEEVRIPSYGFSYGLYNVFPYIVQGYVMRFVSMFTGAPETLLVTARMVNVMFGLLMAMVVYRIGRKCFTDRRFRWLFCVSITYLPENIFMHTYVNTDSCCLLSVAMMVYALISCYREEMNRRNMIWMSGGIILCALSYYNAYGYILSCIILFLAYFLKKENGHVTYAWREMLKKGGFISMIVLLGIGWWFLRSYVVLDGDILGLATREKLASEYAIESVNPLYLETYEKKGYSVWEMMQEKNTLEAAFYSFVAVFGSTSIPGSVWLYRFYKLFFAAGTVGCLYYLANRRERVKMGGKKLLFHGNLLFCIAMPFALMIYYSYTMDYQDQGRYLLPALLPLMYYMVKGIEKLSAWHWGRMHLPRWLIGAGVAFCILGTILGALDMVYLRALPAYLEVGMQY